MSEPLSRGWHRPSIYDVAKVAGVSHMTVSRVLNGHPNIRDSTRERVLAAIDETNFTRSSIARALATKRAMSIGVVVDNAVQYGPNSTLRALERAARDEGYAIRVFSAIDDEDPQIDVGINELVAQGVDALCIVAPRESSLEVLRQHETGVPTLVLKSEPEPSSEPQPAMYTAAVDQRAGAAQAMNHLLELGHRSIAHLAGPLDWYDARAREEIWRASLTDAGLPVSDVLIGDWTSETGYEFGASHDFGDATAIFVANDQMALGLIHGLSERGIRVPEDISVVGFDDVPDSRHYLPPLTTVRQDFAALGALALQLIVAAIDENPVTDSRLIEPRLIVRASTAAPRR